jgi:hypothetical protein
MDQGEAPEYGSGSLVRSVIKAFSGSRFTTQKDSPRESPLFEPLRDAEKAGRINEGEVDGSTDAETKGDVDQMGSRSPIAVSTGEIRQERRLTFREGMEQGVPRSTSEEQQNLQYNHSEQEIRSKEIRSVFGQPGGVPTMSLFRQSPSLWQRDVEDVVGNQNYDGLFDEHLLGRRVRGEEQELGHRDLDREHSRTFPSSFHQYRTEDRSPAGTAGFREPEFGPLGLRTKDSAYKGFNEDLSSRLGKTDGGNITQRDTKRPKERSRDKAYKNRFSLDSTGSGPPFAGFATTRAKVQDGVGRNDSAETPRSIGPPRQNWEDGYAPPPSVVSARAVASATPSENFEIYLTYSGTTVVHQVWHEMLISQLMSEAGSIFGLDSTEMILVLFSWQPTPLQRGGNIMGPPRVTPGSKVIVFHVHSSGSTTGPHAPPTRTAGHGYQSPPYHPDLPMVSTKLLASFKLPKFDGVARTWKVWEKSFTRFLGIHGLDHVLEEDFPTFLWTVPGAKAANKMVYFLVEDAVATGTLASKLVRQATKWHGHEAFTLLRNGYVFNGPQTATILLAELSNMRLLRDEDASGFCLRLVELIEDLELIPGEAAVYLTDTQKLGYLLSAIRHEKSLQAVYSQLQSEQLRGTVSFDQACRELHHRVEAMRADDFLDSRPGRALLSTENKKKGQQVSQLAKVSCLAKDCVEMVQPYLPLCKLCYLQCMAGKIPTLALRDNLGTAVYNSTTKRLDFPSAVPQSRFPKKGLKKGKKILMAGLARESSDDIAASAVVDNQN